MYIQAKDITKTFGGVTALSHVDLDIAEGEVHCLAGENGCGKSTIVKIISGVHSPDSGTISLNGKEYSALSTREALEAGVGVIHQDLSLFSTMTVRDNICLGEHVHHRRSLFRKAPTVAIAQKALARIHADIPLDARVENLSMAQRQQVAIARALALDAQAIFMDEPTTALTQQEVDQLLVTIEKLKASGVSVIFISHKLDEVFSVADRISVFRSGEKIGTYPAAQLNPQKLSTLMTGRDVVFGAPDPWENKNTAPLLRVKNLHAAKISDVNFDIYPGEIVGFSGLLGSGRTETALALFGLNKITGGKILLEEKEIRIHSPQAAIKAGIALVPEDRHGQGLFLEKNLQENASSSVLRSITRHGVVNKAAQEKIGKAVLKNFHVNTTDASLSAQSLSGGNQQKVLLGKWVETRPKVLILDSPTVGVDVGSKQQMYEIIRELARQGIAVCVISDEEEELLSLAHRIYIFADGTTVRELSGAEVSPGFSQTFRGEPMSEGEEND